MKIKKQHILVSALVLALGAAVYLNWHFSGTPLISPSSKELGAATYVSKEAKATTDEIKTTTRDMTPEQKLAKARTERAQAQDQVLEESKTILQAADSSDEAKAEAVKAATAIEERILAQNNIESILSAKGFSDALCYASDKGCTVTVRKSDLKDDSPLIIKDAVMSQLKVEFNDIVIVEL